MSHTSVSSGYTDTDALKYADLNADPAPSDSEVRGDWLGRTLGLGVDHATLGDYVTQFLGLVAPILSILIEGLVTQLLVILFHNN